MDLHISVLIKQGRLHAVPLVTVQGCDNAGAAQSLRLVKSLLTVR